MKNENRKILDKGSFEFGLFIGMIIGAVIVTIGIGMMKSIFG